MKNVQIIDGADNSTFSVFQVDESDFNAIFPNGTDIAFAEDCDSIEPSVFERMWSSPIDKKLLNGIHGTFFIGFHHRKIYFPTLKENEVKTGFENSI